VPDPQDPQSINRYAYALNNPLALIDPSGHVPVGPRENAPVGSSYMGHKWEESGEVAYGEYRHFEWGVQFIPHRPGDAEQVINEVWESWATTGTIGITGVPNHSRRGGPSVGTAVTTGLAALLLLLLRHAPGPGDPPPSPPGTQNGRRDRHIYKSGGFTYQQLTPRPGTDDLPGGGLSFWNRLSHPQIAPGNAIEVDLDRLSPILVVIPDDQPEGHRLVRPAGSPETSDPLLKEWAATRPNANASPHLLAVALMVAARPVRKT